MKRQISLLITLILVLLSALTPARAATPLDWDSENPGVLNEDYLYSYAALLLDADTGEILLEKNSTQRVYPASTTKIMTLLVALESGVSLDVAVTIPLEANDVPADSSLVPLTVGEEMSFRDLLYGMMINSGNDGANSVAMIVSGSISGFVAKMNERAEQLGCTDTHFVNPHGYQDENHYTTARDMARITAEAMKDADFRAIVSARTYTMAGTSKRGPLQLTSKNSLLNPKSTYYYPDAIGVKTGFHSKAGQCFVGAARRGDKTLIAIALNSDPTQKDYKWMDVIRMFEYGFSKFTAYSLADLYNRSSYDITSVVIPNAAANDPQGGALDMDLVKLSDENYIRMVRNEDGALPKAVAEFTDNLDIQLKSNLAAPIDAGEILGNLTYVAPDGSEITGLLIAKRNVAAGRQSISARELFPFLRALDNPLYKGIAVAVLAFILYLIIASAHRSSRRQRRRRQIYRERRREYERRAIRGDFEPDKKGRTRKRYRYRTGPSAEKPAQKSRKNRDEEDDLFF